MCPPVRCRFDSYSGMVGDDTQLRPVCPLSGVLLLYIWYGSARQCLWGLIPIPGWWATTCSWGRYFRCPVFSPTWNCAYHAYFASRTIMIVCMEWRPLWYPKKCSHGERVRFWEVRAGLLYASWLPCRLISFWFAIDPFFGLVPVYFARIACRTLASLDLQKTAAVCTYWAV